MICLQNETENNCVSGHTWLLLEHEGRHLEVEEGVKVLQALGHVGSLVVERSLYLYVKVDQTLLDLQPTNLENMSSRNCNKRCLVAIRHDTHKCLGLV